MSRTALAEPLITQEPRSRLREAAAIAVPRRLAAALYAVGTLFVLTPIADAIANVLPLQPSLATWRYGAVGAFANYLISLLFGALLITTTATLLRHRRIGRVAGVLWALGSLLLLALAADFALDVLQLRSMVPPDQAGAYQVGAAKALVKYLTGAAALMLLASVGLQRRQS